MERLDHADELLFPVRRVPVYADLRGGSREGLERIQGQRAIVNCATDRVISIVSESYQVVTNREALYYGQLCCRAAFPESGGAEWRVLQAQAPTTMGSCRIDLVHPASALDFVAAGTRGLSETYGPFVRVTNSYNRSRALGFEIGFMRLICSNGMLIPDSSIRFAFNHSTRRISQRVRFEVKKDGFKQLKERFQAFLDPLRKCKVPNELFVPTTLAVLRINKPEPLKHRQIEPWQRLARHLESISADYSCQLGPTGYALLNVITDVASRPPDSPFVRRAQHSLQRSAGSWLADFSAKCRESDFDFKAYVDRLKAEPKRASDSRPVREARISDLRPAV